MNRTNVAAVFAALLASTTVEAQVCLYEIRDVLNNPVTELEFSGDRFVETIEPNLHLVLGYSGHQVQETMPGTYAINIPENDWNTSEYFHFSGYREGVEGCMNYMLTVDTAAGCAGTVIVLGNPVGAPGEECKPKDGWTNVTVMPTSGVSVGFPPNPPAPGAPAATKQAYTNAVIKDKQSALNALTASASAQIDGKDLCTGSCPQGQECRPTEITAEGADANSQCSVKVGQFAAGGNKHTTVKAGGGTPNSVAINCRVKATSCACGQKP